MLDIRLDLDRMQAVHETLTDLVAAFDGTERFNDDVAAATGHAALAAVIGEFADWWNVRRNQLTEDLAYVAERAKAIHDTFEELDARMANAVDIVVTEAES